MQPSFICLQLEELKKFIAGDMAPKRVDEIEDHLSTCEVCRGSLEASVGDQDWWQDLGFALRSDNADCECETTESRESVCQRLTALLGPTDDPSMLGRIGVYEIIGLLGYGGMGAVFKGFDRSLNRFVAIKMLLPHLAASGAARKRFAREGQAVAAVVDDHVMAIHCVDEWQGVPYLVMTYSRGVSLQKRLSDNGPLELREILRIGMQAAKGLAAAHAQGIVHRDIKPANIFLDQNVERVQLMDFGLARAVDDASLTRSGTLAGTPQYMSPEQARAETVDHQSDLFSLGSVMYAMCTGHAPFRAESSYSVLRLITDKEPRAIREINPDVPEWLCAIIAKLMAKHPSERYQSAREASALLEECLAHLQHPTSSPLPDSLRPQADTVRCSGRNVTRIGVMTVVGFIGMALLGMVLWQTTEPPDISGHWTSDEWGTVVLENKVPEEYEGTFTGADGDITSEKHLDVPQAIQTENQSGNIHLTWSRVERRFNGTWERGPTRKGKISLRLVDNDIRGAWTTRKDVQKDSDSPRLADLLWTRIHGAIDASKISSDDWELQQGYNPAHDQMVWAVAFTPDGKTIASAGADKRIKLWDVATGSLRSTSLRPVNCTDVAFSPDGTYLAIAGGDHGENPSGELVLMETADGGKEFVLANNESAQYLKSVAFSPDSKWMASGGSDKAVRIWDVEQRQLHKRLTDHTELISQVAFSPDGKILASASFDNTVKLWTVPDGVAIATLRGHEKEVRGIAFSPDNKLLVSVGDDGTARLWNISSHKQLGVMHGQSGPIFSVAFAPDGRHFVTGSRGQSAVRIWDVNKRKSLSPVVLPQQKREVVSLAYSPDGQMLAVAGSWNGFQIWNRKARISGPQLVLEQPTKYFLTLKFYEKREDSVKHLANPTIEVNAGTPFTYIAGGVINEIYSGLRLNGTVGSFEDSTVEASLKIGKENEDFEFNAKLKISETKTIQLDEVTWLDLRIEPDRTDNTLKQSVINSESVNTKVERTTPAKPGEVDLSTPQATLEYIDLFNINNPTHVPVDCYTDDALLEMSGVMLQQFGYMSVLSQIYSQVDTQMRIQTSGVSDEKESGPIIPAALPSFHLQVDALVKEHSLAMPPEQCKKALELLLKSTVASLDGNESRVIPDRELYRLAAGVLKSTREFLPKAGDLSKQFPDSSNEADSHSKEVVTATQYDIEINGDEAIATTLVDRNSSATPMKFKLRRVNQRWLVSEIFSDEILTQINLSMPQMTGDMPTIKTEGVRQSPDVSAFETELAMPSNTDDSPMSLDHSRVISTLPFAWTDFLALLPETGTTLVMFSDEPEIEQQMWPIAKKVAGGASVGLLGIPRIAHGNSRWLTHFLLMKDQQVVDTRYGALTEEKLHEFVAEAKDWLTPHSTGVEENSLVRVDCYIFPGAGNIGTQSGDAFPITAAVIAVHEDQALLLGPDSVAEYVEKGYACVAVVRDADGKQKQLPMEVLLNEPVKLLGRNGEPHKRQASVRITHSDGTSSELPITSILPDPDLVPAALEKYDVDSAIYLIRGFHGLKPVKLAAIEEAIAVGERVLSGGFSQKPIVPVVLDFSPPMQWQTQKVLSIDGVLGNMHGPETFDVLCPSLPVPSGFTFNEHGRLIGKYALGSPTHEDMKHGVFKSHATHSIIHAVLDKIDDAGLKAALLRTLD